MAVVTGHTCGGSGFKGSLRIEQRKAECRACQRIAARSNAVSEPIEVIEPNGLRETPREFIRVKKTSAGPELWVGMILARIWFGTSCDKDADILAESLREEFRAYLAALPPDSDGETELLPCPFCASGMKRFSIPLHPKAYHLPDGFEGDIVECRGVQKSALPPEMEERTARSLLSAIASKHRNSDLRMDHPDVKALVDGLLDTIRVLQAKTMPWLTEDSISDPLKKYLSALDYENSWMTTEISRLRADLSTRDQETAVVELPVPPDTGEPDKDKAARYLRNFQSMGHWMHRVWLALGFTEKPNLEQIVARAAELRAENEGLQKGLDASETENVRLVELWALMPHKDSPRGPRCSSYNGGKCNCPKSQVLAALNAGEAPR